jgi:TfoX/Sxy family transcriptional regulator of competence genes
MGRNAESIPADKLELYEKLVATNLAVERKGAKTPYTSLNGHMFSFLTEDGTMALRLPTEEREAFTERYKTNPIVRYGSVMKEYVEVPEGLLEDTQELKRYFDISYAYIGTLKPKPTKRKKKS